MEIHGSAHKHGFADEDIGHALAHVLVVVDLEPEADPPKVLAIGPDRAANLLEVIWIELEDERQLVTHAMPLRRAFFDLLPDEEPSP